MSRRKRSRRSRSTSPRDNVASEERAAPRHEESIEEAHARMAAEFEGQSPTDEEIEADHAAVAAAALGQPGPDPELDEDYEPCDLPPQGWTCTREAGHEGPCAAIPADEDAPADPTDPEWDAVAWLEPPSEIDWSLFEKGPLAAGVQILEAILEEAKGGYIAAQIATLEAVLQENFNWDDRAVLTQVASTTRNEVGLPDIAGAYRAMVANRAAKEDALT